MGSGILNNAFYLLGGMAIMLFGMSCMGANLERVAGNNLKKLLGKVTSNRFAGVGIGAVVTGVIQSSAATTVMMVGFVNVGLMTLSQTVPVIMGANIGTTITAQLLSLTGFGFDASAYGALIAGVGAVFALFTKKDKLQKIGYILLGAGMIFVGLEVMSASVDKIIYMEDGSEALKPFFMTIFQGDHFPLLLVLIGIVFTAVIQSSSAVTGILVALSGALKFQNAVFIILGSNIGTCITALISAIGTNTNAKRTAVIHLLFNCLGCLIALAPLWIWADAFESFIVTISGTSPERQIANFHTLFNLTTTLVLLPFVNALVFLATKIVRGKKGDDEEDLCKFHFIDPRLMETPRIALDNTKKEIIRMARIAKTNISLAVDMLITGNNEELETVKKNEECINFLNKNITAFLIKLSNNDLNLEDEKKIGSYYHVITDIERVGDYAENITEYLAKLKEENLGFSNSAKNELKAMVENVDMLFDVTLEAFDTRNLALLARVDEIEELIDKANEELEIMHITRLKQNLCTPQVGSIYLQTISNLERVGDHITNVAFSIKQYVEK